MNVYFLMLVLIINEILQNWISLISWWSFSNNSALKKEEANPKGHLKWPILISNSVVFEQFAFWVHHVITHFLHGGHLKTGHTSNAVGQLIFFPLVREKKFTDGADIITFAEIPLFSGSSGEYGMERYFKCVKYEGKKKAFQSSTYSRSPFL